MMLSEAAKLINAQLVGDDQLFTSVSKDTRDIKSGELYVALKGANFDGHDFVNAALAKGAAGAMVSDICDSSIAQLKVHDTHNALGSLARQWRLKFPDLKVVGVTGSNGKTTVKEMITTILRAHACSEKVLFTQGNLNNDIGMPMTLLGLRAQHEYAVIEMGANHAGEIDYLTKIALPDVVVITNISSAHIEGFGSLDGTAKAKAEIYNGLSSEGVAVLNKDDAYYDYWESLPAQYKKITFSLNDDSADAFAKNVRQGAFTLVTGEREYEVKLKVPGNHNVMNALAAVCVTGVVGVKAETAAKALNGFSGVSGRIENIILKNGVEVINDTYNANPGSFKAAIDVLAEKTGSKWLVMGDMGELGELSSQLHFDVGAYAKEHGVDSVFVTGQFSHDVAKGFENGAVVCDCVEELIDRVRKSLKANTVVLVKGSRFMKMERVVQELSRQYGGSQ